MLNGSRENRILCRGSVLKRIALSDDAPLSHRMIAQGRYALLLRPQIAANLTRQEVQNASGRLDDAMAIVPEGDVILKSWRDDHEADDSTPRKDRLVHVEALYLDRYPVTNREFLKFVRDGGYEQMSLWDPENLARHPGLRRPNRAPRTRLLGRRKPPVRKRRSSGRGDLLV